MKDQQQLGLFGEPRSAEAPEAVRPRIRIGTSSWSDPGFVADWYPPGLPARARLGWYAAHFDYVEVNSTFYAIPAARVVERWARETPGHFLFDVKLPKLLSRHAAAIETLPADLRKDARTDDRGKVVLDAELEERVAKRFCEEIEPLRAEGKLGAFLLQLSPAFSPRRHGLEELLSLRTHFDRLAIELRNRDWMSGMQLETTLQFFRKHDLPLVLVDAPASEHFTVMPRSNAVTAPRLAYLRLHGRNEKGYIRGKSVAERFDYDYSSEEIAEIAGRVTRLAAAAEEVHVAFNNNRSHYAPKAALALKRRLAEA